MGAKDGAAPAEMSVYYGPVALGCVCVSSLADEVDLHRFDWSSHNAPLEDALRLSFVQVHAPPPSPHRLGNWELHRLERKDGTAPLGHIKHEAPESIGRESQ